MSRAIDVSIPVLRHDSREEAGGEHGRDHHHCGVAVRFQPLALRVRIREVDDQRDGAREQEHDRQRQDLHHQRRQRRHGQCGIEPEEPRQHRPRRRCRSWTSAGLRARGHVARRAPDEHGEPEHRRPCRRPSESPAERTTRPPRPAASSRRGSPDRPRAGCSSCLQPSPWCTSGSADPSPAADRSAASPARSP